MHYIYIGLIFLDRRAQSPGKNLFIYTIRSSLRPTSTSLLPLAMALMMTRAAESDDIAFF